MTATSCQDADFFPAVIYIYLSKFISRYDIHIYIFDFSLPVAFELEEESEQDGLEEFPPTADSTMSAGALKSSFFPFLEVFLLANV